MEIVNVAIGLTGPWKSTLRQQIDIQVRSFPGRANHLRPDEGSGPVHGGGIGPTDCLFPRRDDFFPETSELCSVRHKRRSNETIHSNECPQTKTNPSFRT